jgi:PAS domain S-box-containing protein
MSDGNGASHAAAFFRRAPLAAFVTDADGRVLVCNETYAQLLGLTVDTVVGRTNAELFGEAQARQYAARNAEVLAQGAPMDVVDTFQAPDGERTYVITLFPASPTAVGGAILDVTGRLSAQRAVDRQERTLKAVLETVNDGVWLVGRDWKTTYANPALARLLGTTVDDLVGRAPTEFIRQQDGPEVERQKRARENGATGGPSETRLVRKDGREAWVLASSAPLRDARGQFDGAVAVLMDITGRKARELDRQRDESRRRETQRLESLGVLAGGVAHDFNNLLTGVLGNIALLRAEVGEGASETVDLIEESATRAAALCRQMLAFSGRGAFVMKPAELSELVASSLTLVRSSLGGRHALTSALPKGLGRVLVDASQLSQVVVNLVMNASEAIGDRAGQITVNTRRVRLDRAALDQTYLAPALPEGDYVELSVRDDGGGIAGEVKDRLFEPFVSTRGPGRGLGLSAVLGVVRGHQAAVEVSSEPGRGTTVRLFFQVLPASSLEVERPERLPSSGPGRLVLVVDDEPLMRSTLRRMLTRQGFLVEEARDGLEALELMKGLAPDLVLLDVSMPRLDGASTFLELRKRGAKMPVVLMSGYSEQDALQGVLRDDLAGFLQKPFAPDALARALEAAFKR